MSPPTNYLIRKLPSKDRRRMLGICEVVKLEFGNVLSEADARTRYVYFPTGGFVVGTEGNRG